MDYEPYTEEYDESNLYVFCALCDKDITLSAQHSYEESWICTNCKEPWIKYVKNVLRSMWQTLITVLYAKPTANFVHENVLEPTTKDEPIDQDKHL